MVWESSTEVRISRGSLFEETDDMMNSKLLHSFWPHPRVDYWFILHFAAQGYYPRFKATKEVTGIELGDVVVECYSDGVKVIIKKSRFPRIRSSDNLHFLDPFCRGKFLWKIDHSNSTSPQGTRRSVSHSEWCKEFPLKGLFPLHNCIFVRL